MGPESTTDYVRRAVWGMLYADGVCIILRSPQGLANKVVDVFVEVCRPSLRVNRVGEEDKGHVHATTVYTADDGTSRSSRANLQTGAILNLPKGAVTETPDMSVEIARRTRASGGTYVSLGNQKQCRGIYCTISLIAMHGYRTNTDTREACVTTLFTEKSERTYTLLHYIYDRMGVTEGDCSIDVDVI